MTPPTVLELEMNLSYCKFGILLQELKNIILKFIFIPTYQEP